MLRPPTPRSPPLPWRRAALTLLAAVAVAGCGGASAPEPESMVEEDGPETLAAPIDVGAGPGVAATEPRRQALGAAQAAGVPTGPADAHEKGVFDAAFGWPIIPVHTVLLPDGRVLSYGTKPSGIQGGQLHYAVWDPALGTGPEAHQLLQHTTGTDIFCAGQALLPMTGDVLLVGGDRLVNGKRNYANRDVNLFTRADNALTRQAQAMAYQRWYATVITSATGEQVVIGGRDDRYYEGDALYPPTDATYASTPEVYNASTGWRTLTTAKSEHAYGSVMQSWNYPRAWWSPDGRVVSLTPAGKLFALNVAGTGSFVQLPGAVPKGAYNLPAVMYQPGKILAVREAAQAALIDLNNGSAPVVSVAAPLSADRQFGNATVLADGSVWVNGGSSTGNDLVGAVYHSETWNPATGAWRTAATAAKARLYHSVSMLMPDGSVLTGGGGAPGPIFQLNAETYYPPYLYKTDGSGLPAERPAIAAAPTAGTWGQKLQLTLAAKAPVSRVTLVRFGAVTHAFSNEQRFQDLPFTQAVKKLGVTLPASANNAPPGFYMLFVFDAAGVPSKAAVLRIG